MLAHGLVTLAQVPVPADALSGGGGWAGAGLLGLVLAWLLLVHLPRKDEQMRQMLDRHDEQMEKKRQAYDASLHLITEHCEKELRTITESVVSELRLLRAAVLNQKGQP